MVENILFRGTMAFSTINTYFVSANRSTTLTVPKGALIVLTGHVGGGPYYYSGTWGNSTGVRLLIFGPIQDASDYPLCAFLEATSTSVTIVNNTGITVSILVAS